MAITSTQKTEILKIVAGLFNAAPGGSNLTELANLVSGGMSTSQLADALAANTLFTSGIMGGKVTVEEQASVLAHNFGLAADSDPASAGSQAVAYFTQLINDGVGFGNIVFQAVTYLSGTPATEFTEAATLLANKALVSAAYSESNSSSDLSTLQNILSAVTGTSLYTATEVAAALAAVGSGTSAGKSFTLTTGVDVGASFTGTSSNDTYIGTSSLTNPTINLGDSIDGGAGTADTLYIFTDLAGAIPSIVTKNIENYSITNSANGTFAVNGLSTDPSSVKFVGGGNNTFTLSGIGASTTVALEAESGQLTLTLDSVTGSSDALSLGLNGSKSTASVAAAGIETFNVSTVGSDSTLAALTGAQGSKLVVTGDKELTITADLANTFTTIDASAATAAVNLGVATGGNATITGGAGDDRIHVVGLDTNDEVNGGGGAADILAVDADVTASNVSKVTNFEKLEFTAATTQDLSLVSATGIKTFVFTNAAGNAAYTNNADAFHHVMSEKTAGTFSATAALNGPSDVLNVELSNSDLTTLTASNYETVNLLSSVGSGTGTVTNIITTLTNSAAANIVITGDTNLTITNAIAAQGTVDASAFTGKLSVIGSASADVIKGGSGVDTIKGGVGVDALTGGGGADIFVVTTTAAATDSTDSAYDLIKDFNTGGADILRFDAAENVAGAAATAAVATTSVSISAGGKAAFAAADDTLAEMLVTLAADNTNIANNEVVFFELGSDTYVYGAGVDTTAAADDFLVKLTGVTGLTTLTESTTTAGDFTIG